MKKLLCLLLALAVLLSLSAPAFAADTTAESMFGSGRGSKSGVPRFQLARPSSCLFTSPRWA